MALKLKAAIVARYSNVIHKNRKVLVYWTVGGDGIGVYGRSALDGFCRYAHARVPAESRLVSIKLVLAIRARFCIASGQ